MAAIGKKKIKNTKTRIIIRNDETNQFGEKEIKLLQKLRVTNDEHEANSF